jgi:hypothetical protein
MSRAHRLIALRLLCLGSWEYAVSHFILIIIFCIQQTFMSGALTEKNKQRDQRTDPA